MGPGVGRGFVHHAVLRSTSIVELEDLVEFVNRHFLIGTFPRIMDDDSIRTRDSSDQHYGVAAGKLPILYKALCIA